MVSKALLVVKSKVGLAALSVLVLGGATAVGLAATRHPTTTANQGSNTASHAHSISVEGVLKGYNAGANTISVIEHGDTSATTLEVNAKTEVNGEHASSLSDLSKVIGNKVQVQVTRQSNGTLLAWKITVEAASGTQGTGQNHHHGHGHGHGQEQIELHG